MSIFQKMFTFREMKELSIFLISTQIVYIRSPRKPSWDWQEHCQGKLVQFLRNIYFMKLFTTKTNYCLQQYFPIKPTGISKQTTKRLNLSNSISGSASSKSMSGSVSTKSMSWSESSKSISRSESSKEKSILSLS